MLSYLKEKLLNSKDKNKGLPKVDSLGLIFQEPPKKQKNAFRTRPVFYRFTSLRFSIHKLYPESISLFFILKCKFRSATICQSFHFFVRWKITFFCVMLDGPVPRFLSVYFKDWSSCLFYFIFREQKVRARRNNKEMLKHEIQFMSSYHNVSRVKTSKVAEGKRNILIHIKYKLKFWHQCGHFCKRVSCILHLKSHNFLSSLD